MQPTYYILIGIILIAAIGFVLLRQNEEFPLPNAGSESRTLTDVSQDALDSAEMSDSTTAANDTGSAAPAGTGGAAAIRQSNRDVEVTDGTKHSIPLNEILSGGPGKDGIPSIDDPEFISAGDAGFLKESDPGIGLAVGGESRFYPYRILVWHEIVNDTIAGEPVLVTYCPLCATGIVFDRRVNGQAQEFGVSGQLWQSNLLMYNRADSEENESLWSQVLGEAVVGPETGERLEVIPSEITRWGDWRQAHPSTQVLSRETGAFRNYSSDPYGDYYTSQSVSFGASFSDDRTHPKTLVHGIEINGEFKAYVDEDVQAAGRVEDTFAGRRVVVEATDAGGVRFTADGEPLSSIPGFWFSWVAVHPDTALWQAR